MKIDVPLTPKFENIYMLSRRKYIHREIWRSSTDSAQRQTTTFLNLLESAFRDHKISCHGSLCYLSSSSRKKAKNIDVEVNNFNRNRFNLNIIYVLLVFIK
jgi:hypothetical protein